MMFYFIQQFKGIFQFANNLIWHWQWSTGVLLFYILYGSSKFLLRIVIFLVISALAALQLMRNVAYSENVIKNPI